MPALLFDIDGTMIHSDPIHAKIFEEIFARDGRRIDMDFYLEHIHGRQSVDIFAEYFPDADAQAMDDEKEARFREILGDRADEMPGLTPLLDRAAAEGWDIAAVTNAPRANAEAMMKAIGVRRRFEIVIAQHDTPKGKPDPAPYALAMRRLGAKPADCLVFEDSAAGVTAGAASGALTVGVASGLTPLQLSDAGAAATITDFTDPALGDILARLTGAFT